MFERIAVRWGSRPGLYVIERDDEASPEAPLGNVLWALKVEGKMIEQRVKDIEDKRAALKEEALELLRTLNKVEDAVNGAIYLSKHDDG